MKTFVKRLATSIAMVSAIGGVTVVNTGVANAGETCSRSSCTNYAGGGHVRVTVYTDKTVTGSVFMTEGEKQEVWLDSTNLSGGDYRGMNPKGTDGVIANSSGRKWRACASPVDGIIYCTSWVQSY